MPAGLVNSLDDPCSPYGVQSISQNNSLFCCVGNSLKLIR
jgi:hypothetical protein